MDIASIIEHTLLAPDASEAMIDRHCAEAIQYKLRAVCVNPIHVARAVALLRGRTPYVVSVVGFPTGATFTQIKVREAARAVEQGAKEIDMVMRIGALKEGKTDQVEADIAAVVRAVSGHPVKVILETGRLTDEEIQTACRVVEQAGAAFVKTSTGFLGAGATVEAVALMRASLGLDVGIKASGGIKDMKFLLELLDAGADRIGTSSGVEMMKAMQT